MAADAGLLLRTRPPLPMVGGYWTTPAHRSTPWSLLLVRGGARHTDRYTTWGPVSCSAPRHRDRTQVAPRRNTAAHRAALTGDRTEGGDGSGRSLRPTPAWAAAKLLATALVAGGTGAIRLWLGGSEKEIGSALGAAR